MEGRREKWEEGSEEGDKDRRREKRRGRRERKTCFRPSACFV